MSRSNFSLKFTSIQKKINKLLINRILQKTNMKSIVTIIAIVFSTLVYGQNSPQEKASLLSNEMKVQLGLSDVQFDKVSALNEGVELKIDAIQNNASMTPDRKEEFISGNRNDQMNALSLILTPGQMQQLQNHKDEIFSVIE